MSYVRTVSDEYIGSDWSGSGYDRHGAACATTEESRASRVRKASMYPAGARPLERSLQEWTWSWRGREPTVDLTTEFGHFGRDLTGNVMDIYAYSKANGALVDIYPRNGQLNQVFYLTNQQIQGIGDKCLDDTGFGGAGTLLEIYMTATEAKTRRGITGTARSSGFRRELRRSGREQPDGHSHEHLHRLAPAETPGHRARRLDQEPGDRPLHEFDQLGLRRFFSRPARGLRFHRDFRQMGVAWQHLVACRQRLSHAKRGRDERHTHRYDDVQRGAAGSTVVLRAVDRWSADTQRWERRSVKRRHQGPEEIRPEVNRPDGLRVAPALSSCGMTKARGTRGTRSARSRPKQPPCRSHIGPHMNNGKCAKLREPAPRSGLRRSAYHHDSATVPEGALLRRRRTPGAGGHRGDYGAMDPSSARKVRPIASRVAREQLHATDDGVRSDVEVRHRGALGPAPLLVCEERLARKEARFVGERFAREVDERSASR